MDGDFFTSQWVSKVGPQEKCCKISGVAENTAVDENLVVCKSSEKMVDENSVVDHFSGVDYYTWSRFKFSYQG